MATKSPGIYFHEIDNTQFTNPKAITGTTLGIVGYARKGPIGVPTQINSWVEFTDTFGKPVEGFYSGLAVNTFLNAGGSVLFERVADDTASPSNYVVKNAANQSNGYVSFSRGDDITVGEKGYENKRIYGFKLSTAASGKPWKYFFVRTPETTKLTQGSIRKQVEEQLGETSPVYEAKLKEKIPNGLYSYNIVTEDGPISTEDFYIQANEELVKSNFVNKLRQRALTASNARVEVEISSAATYSGNFDTDLPSKEYQTTITGTKKFILVFDGEERPIDVEMTDTKLTLDKIATKLTTALSPYDIIVFPVYGTNEKSNSKLVFVSTRVATDQKFDIKSYTKKGEPMVQEKEAYVDLFSFQKSNENSNSNFVVNPGSVENTLFVAKYTSTPAKITSNVNFVMSYDEVMDSIILEGNSTGSGKTIKLVDGDVVKPEETKLSLVKNVVLNEFNREGQDAIDILPYVDKDGKFSFENKNTIVPPAIERIGNDEYVGGEGHHYLELLDIMRVPGDTEGKGHDEPVTGEPAIPASTKDMVVFTSREVGSGTNNIAVEVYRKTNPVDKSVSCFLDVLVNGVKKTTYENISLNYNDVEKRFDTIINESVENGGSPYITAEVFKNDFEDPNVQLPDGLYFIGKPSEDGDVAKPADVSYDTLNSYNYTVGTDGIPEEGGYGLFEKAMEPGTSALANKELYDFHILIAPDDITEPVQTACIKLCEDRGDAVTIVDPPIGLNKKAVIDWHNGRGFGRTTAVESNYAAVYWPWCKIFDTTSGKGKFTWVMPSVIMAAKYAAVDKGVGCQMAPAGEQNGRLSVIDIEQYPNALDRDELYVDYNRINPITKFKDGSIIAYGEKTTQRTNSVLTKIHTRRMLVQIKKQCREALRGYIFMPNTSDYLGKVNNSITAILEQYRTNGGLNFYKVICDETNNPTEVRQQDIINVDVVLVPEGTIEQINISLTLNKTAETVTD